MYQLIVNKHTHLFLIKSDKTIVPDVKLAIALEVVRYPRLAAMSIVAIGGSNLQVFYDKFWKALCGWSYINGVRVLEGWVAPGMERIISRYGFKKMYSLMRYDLTEK